jgi:thiamine pyrophosphokinase
MSSIEVLSGLRIGFDVNHLFSQFFARNHCFSCLNPDVNFCLAGGIIRSVALLDKYNVGVQNRTLGVLAGLDLSDSVLKIWAQNCNILMAADSAADRLLALGHPPLVIVGDFDSLEATSFPRGVELCKIEDQNLSDCDKLLQLAYDRGGQKITLAGIEGDRLDHLIASLHSAMKTPLQVNVATRDGIAHLLKPGRYRLPTASHEGKRISFLPLKKTTGIQSSGLEWPLPTTLELGEAVSLSNIATGAEVTVEFAEGALLACLPRTLAELPDWCFAEPF